jgi:hypothetical protein
MPNPREVDAAGRAAGRERAMDDGIVPKRQWKREKCCGRSLATATNREDL